MPPVSCLSAELSCCGQERCGAVHRGRVLRAFVCDEAWRSHCLAGAPPGLSHVVYVYVCLGSIVLPVIVR